MAFNRKARRWWGNDEVMKAHVDIPDGLGIGVHEMRADGGELCVYFRGNNTTPASAWVVLGKFARPRPEDGKQFYVSDRTRGVWTAEAKVTYHEDLLMAVSWIVELKNQFDGRN